MTRCRLSRRRSSSSSRESKPDGTGIGPPAFDDFADHRIPLDVGVVNVCDLQLATPGSINNADRLPEREALHAVGRYPNSVAVSRIAGGFILLVRSVRESGLISRHCRSAFSKPAMYRFVCR